MTQLSKKVIKKIEDMVFNQNLALWRRDNTTYDIDSIPDPYNWDLKIVRVATYRYFSVFENDESVVELSEEDALTAIGSEEW